MSKIKSPAERRHVSSICFALAALVDLTAAPTLAAPEHCKDREVTDVSTMDPAVQIDWLTDEIEGCTKPSNKRADDYLQRGIAYSRLGDVDNSLADYSTAISLNPGDPKYYFWRGDAYCSLEPPDVESGMQDSLKAAALSTGSDNYAEFLQTSLAIAGYYDGPIDGVFGPKSQAAFRAYCAAGGAPLNSGAPGSNGAPAPDADSAPSSYVTLVVCNESDEEVFVAYASLKAPGSSTWTLQGWRDVPARACNDAAVFVRGNLYVYAESQNHRWTGSSRTFCVPQEAFERDLTDGYTCRSDERLLGFYEKEIYDSTETFTWTLTE